MQEATHTGPWSADMGCAAAGPAAVLSDTEVQTGQCDPAAEGVRLAACAEVGMARWADGKLGSSAGCRGSGCCVK